MIEEDTPPVFTDPAANDPDVVLDESATPVGERADGYTIGSRWDDQVEHALTDRNLGVDVDHEIDW